MKAVARLTASKAAATENARHRKASLIQAARQTARQLPAATENARQQKAKQLQLARLTVPLPLAATASASSQRGKLQQAAQRIVELDAATRVASQALASHLPSARPTARENAAMEFAKPLKARLKQLALPIAALRRAETACVRLTWEKTLHRARLTA